MARHPDQPRGSPKGGKHTGKRPSHGAGGPRSGQAGGQSGNRLRIVETDVRSPQADRPAPPLRPDDKLLRIAGLPSVAQLFDADPDRVERLYFETAAKSDVEGFCTLLARRRKVYRLVGQDEMRRVAGTAMHGGVVALARPRPIRDLDLAHAEEWAKAGAPLLILDGVGNPQNIGAIARTAAFFGVTRLVLSDHPAQAGLSDTSYRIAKGALERIQVYRATRLDETLRRLGAFYHVVGTTIGRGKDLKRIDKTGKPIALVMGNEEDGLSSGTIAACGSIVSLAGSGKVQSLNVSAAAAILIHVLLAPG